MMNQSYNDLFALWISENYDKILGKWMELIRIPSVVSSPENNAPFGINCRKALEKSAAYFSESGFKTDIFLKEGYAISSYGEGEKVIGLFAHSDVVPAGDDWMYTSAFEPIVKDGALIGRGAEDNKSGIIASLCLFEFLKEHKILLKNKIEVFIGSDEECGMKDLIQYLKNHNMPDISLVPDADYPCSVGEKGILHFFFKSKTAFNDIVDCYGGEAYNIVLDKCTVKIKFSDSLYNELKSKVNENSSFDLSVFDSVITITAKGVAKHASIPEDSVNAAYLLAQLLGECESLNKSDRSVFINAAKALSCYYGNGIGINHTDPVFGKTTAVNGMVKLDDGKISLSFDVRYGDSLSPDTLEEIVKSNAEKLGFDVRDIDNRKGFLIDKDNKVPDVLEKVFYETTGEPLKRVLMSGGTYARRLKNAFSVGTCYISQDRKDEVFKMPQGHGGPHQCDEMIDLEGFFTSVRILLNYVLACDKHLSE